MATARRPPDTAYQRALRRARQLGPNATIEPHDAHQDGGRRHYHVVLNGRPVAAFPFGTPVRRGAHEFEDAAQAEAESLGDLVHQITQAFPTSAIPSDVKRDLVTQARMIYSVRGALLARLMATVYALIRTRNLPPPVALQVGARQLGLRPNPAPTGAHGRLSDPQVRQYHRRQEQRSRRPGQNPQMRSRLQREAEALFEAPAPPRTRAEAELEAMLRRVDRAIGATVTPRQSHGPDFLIGDPANPPNDGRDPSPYHDRVLARVIRHMQQQGWRDIRREQTQVAGGARRPVEATQPAQTPLPGLNFPDGSGIDRRSRRTHIEIDTDPRASLDHQARIFAADSNPALGPLARRSRGVFVVIDPRTGRVTSVRHVRHDPRGGQPIVRETRYAGRGMPIQNLLTLGLLNRPVAPRTAQQPMTRRRRSTAGLPGRRQQRESEFAGLAYV